MRPMLSKTVLAALCVGLMSSGAMAAAGAAKGDGRGQMLITRLIEPFRTALGKVTNLTDEQKTKTDAILADATAQVQAIVDDAKADAKDAKATPAAAGNTADRGARRQKIMDLETATRDKILAVLTDEQKPEFKTALADARTAARGEGRGAGLGGRRGGGAGATTKPAA